MKKNKITKKKTVIICFVVLSFCFGAYTVIGGLSSNSEMTNTSQNIPEHDGDVLVDSINVEDSQKTEDSSDNKKEKTVTTSSAITSDDTSQLKNSDTYFDEMRASLDMDRNQIISMLTDTISESDNESEKKKANEEKIKIIGYMEKEKTTENLIRTKSLPECFVVVTDSGVNVTVNKQDLTQSDVAKICDIVMRETGRKASEIVIQSKY